MVKHLKKINLITRIQKTIKLRLSKMKNSILILLAMAFLILSCSKEETMLENNSPEHIAKTGSKQTLDKNEKIEATICDITGNTTVCPGSKGIYNYSANFNVNHVNWTVVSGNMSILGGQGTNGIGVSFGSNFTGGSLRAFGTGSETCSETIYISKSNVTCANPALGITTLIPACYPASFPLGRYRLTGVPSGGSVTWSARNANITLISGTEIYVEATSSYDFSLIATVTWPKNDPCSPGATCTKAITRRYIPDDCSGGLPGPF